MFIVFLTQSTKKSMLAFRTMWKGGLLNITKVGIATLKHSFPGRSSIKNHIPITVLHGFARNISNQLLVKSFFIKYYMQVSCLRDAVSLSWGEYRFFSYSYKGNFYPFQKTDSTTCATEILIGSGV